MKRICIQCGKEFELTNSEIGFYKKRKLSLPKRCRECREQNRTERKDGQGDGAKKSASVPSGTKALTEKGNLSSGKKSVDRNAVSQSGRSGRTSRGYDKKNVQNTGVSGKEQKEFQQSFRKPRTDRQQASDKSRTDRQQASDKSRTDRQQTFDKSRTDLRQASGRKSGKKRSVLAAVGVCAAALIYYLATGQLPEFGTSSTPQSMESVQSSQEKTDAQNGQSTQKKTDAQNAQSAQKNPDMQKTKREDIDAEIVYTFRSEELFEDHYEKHGIEMGFASAEDYLEGANYVISSEEALHKIEAEDGDDIYFLEDTNEFVVVSTDGYIRTYFEPDDGLEYYERQ